MEQDNSFVHSTLDNGEDIYITDQWKRKYHFKMASFPAPTGLAFEAIEVKYDNSPGHQFNHLFDFDTDLEVAAQTFLKKIRKGLNQRHLKKKVPNGKLVPEIYYVVELTGMKIFLTPISIEYL